MLPPHCHRRVRVAEQADLAAVRGVAADLAAAAGMGEQAAGRVQLVVAAIALVTANAQDTILAEADRLGVRFIPKPVRRQDVARFLLNVGHSLQKT